MRIRSKGSLWFCRKPHKVEMCSIVFGSRRAPISRVFSSIAEKRSGPPPGWRSHSGLARSCILNLLSGLGCRCGLHLFRSFLAAPSLPEEYEIEKLHQRALIAAAGGAHFHTSTGQLGSFETTLKTCFTRSMGNMAFASIVVRSLEWGEHLQSSSR